MQKTFKMDLYICPSLYEMSIIIMMIIFNVVYKYPYDYS